MERISILEEENRELIHKNLHLKKLVGNCVEQPNRKIEENKDEDYEILKIFGNDVSGQNGNYPFKFVPFVMPDTDDNLLENLLKVASGALDFLEHTIPFDPQVSPALSQHVDLLQSVSKRVSQLASNPIMKVNHTMTPSDRLMLRIIKRNFETIMPDIKQLQLVILPYAPYYFCRFQIRRFFIKV